jgi:hypothetical protein
VVAGAVALLVEVADGTAAAGAGVPKAGVVPDADGCGLAADESIVSVVGGRVTFCSVKKADR